VFMHQNVDPVDLALRRLKVVLCSQLPRTTCLIKERRATVDKRVNLNLDGTFLPLLNSVKGNIISTIESFTNV